VLGVKGTGKEVWKMASNELLTTREKVTDDFIDTLPRYMQDEYFMFLSGFVTGFRASGVKSIPMDSMDVFDEYMEVVDRRTEQEKKDGVHDA
jgi:hypothetical protein